MFDALPQASRERIRRGSAARIAGFNETLGWSGGRRGISFRFSAALIAATLFFSLLSPLALRSVLFPLRGRRRRSESGGDHSLRAIAFKAGERTGGLGVFSRLLRIETAIRAT